MAYRGEVGFQDLRQVLEAQERSTKLVRISHPRQLMLDWRTGQTDTGLMFNRDAFWQVCRAIAGGLFTVMATVWDESAGVVDESERQACVLRAYNSLLRLQTKRLDGWRLVVDRETKVVVGLVGRQYQYVSNQYVMAMVRGKMRQAGSDYRFVRAVQRNRDIMVYLINPRLIAVGDSLTVRQGLAIFNSETTHRAIYFPRIIFDSLTGSFSMSPESKQNRLAHRRRKNFDLLLQSLVDTAFKSEAEPGKLSIAFRRLRQRPVDSSSDESLLERVVEFATEHRISNEVALKVATIAVSAKVDPRMQWVVYEAFLKVADESAGSDRVLRQCAFRLLRG